MTYTFAYLVQFMGIAAAIWSAGYAVERSLMSISTSATSRPQAGDEPSERAAPWMRALSRWVLGLTVWVVGLFTLACLGILGSPAILSLGAAVFGAAIWMWVRQGQPVWVPARDIGTWAAAVALAAWVAPYFFLTATPQMAWDADTYHLTVPKIWLENSGFVWIPFNIYSSFPSNLQLLYAPLLALGDFILAKTLHFGFGVLTAWSLFEMGRRWGTPAAGWIAAALFLANGVVLAELTTAYSDLAYAFLLLCGFASMHRALDCRGAARRNALWIAGLSCGLMAGIKATGGFGVAAVASLLVRREFWREPHAFRHLLLQFLLPVTLLVAPWWIKSALYTGNPVYPLFYEFFGGPEWSHGLAADLSEYLRSIGMGRGLLDYVLLPIRVIFYAGPEYDRFSGEVSPIWAAAVLIALSRVRGDGLVRRALGVSAVYFLLWAATSQQARFLIPILPLLALAAALAGAHWLSKLPMWASSATARRCVIASVVAIVLWLGAQADDSLERAGRWWARRADWQQRDPVKYATPRAYAYLNSQAPEDSSVVLLQTNHGFFLDRAYLADGVFRASQLSDWLNRARSAEEIDQLLRARRVTFVVDRHKTWQTPVPGLRKLLADPNRAELVFRDLDFSIYMLRRTSAGSPHGTIR